MAGGMNSSKDDITPESVEKAKKRGRLGGFIFLGVLLLGVVLPPAYKALAPFLFVIPIIVSVVNKIRQVSVKSGNPPIDQTYSQSMPHQTASSEPYTSKPKDPEDPRRYKPIG